MRELSSNCVVWDMYINTDLTENMIEKSNISLAKIALTIGLSITFLSFRDYFINNVEGNGLSSLGFIYGIPITLIGYALQYAELQPAMIISTPDSKKIFNLILSSQRFSRRFFQKYM